MICIITNTRIRNGSCLDENSLFYAQGMDDRGHCGLNIYPILRNWGEDEGDISICNGLLHIHRCDSNGWMDWAYRRLRKVNI